MTFVIADPCLTSKDGACVEACPVDCIKTSPGQDQYFIDPEECVGCGACVNACPVKAIFSDDQLPPQWAAATSRNAAFFAFR